MPAFTTETEKNKIFLTPTVIRTEELRDTSANVLGLGKQSLRVATFTFR